MTARERLSSSSFPSTRRSTLTSQSDCRSQVRPRNSSASESESVSAAPVLWSVRPPGTHLRRVSQARFSDLEEDPSRTPAAHQSSSNGKQARHSSQRAKVRGHGSGRFERSASSNPTEAAAAAAASLLTQITVSVHPPSSVTGFRPVSPGCDGYRHSPDVQLAGQPQTEA